MRRVLYIFATRKAAWTGGNSYAPTFSLYVCLKYDNSRKS